MGAGQASGRTVVGARLVVALFATALLVGGGLILLLGIVALGHAFFGGNTPIPFGLGVVALGGACGAIGLLLGRSVRLPRDGQER